MTDDTATQSTGRMTPDVSVIIPAHNRCAMVCEAVESVLAQTGGVDFELIAVDDGCSDGTFEHLNQGAAGNHAMRVERIEHSGPAAARNRGVACSRGSWIAFLDSDDLWMPTKLSRQLSFVRAHSGLGICQTQEIWIRNGRRVNPGVRHIKRGGDIFVDSLVTCLISPSAVMLRTDLFRATGGFDEAMLAAEDYDLWLRILVDHEIGLLDEPLVTRRAGHRDQQSASTPAIDRFRILALAKLLADSRLDRRRRCATAGVLSEKCRIYAGGLERRGNREAADFYSQTGELARTRWKSAPDDSIEQSTARMRSLLKEQSCAVMQA
ncbi:MAG TPA: glycosyltransferase family A protein [Candidatus Binataceae bacterium]